MFTTAMLDQLRANYSKIERMDPCGPTCRKMIALLDRMTADQLKQLAEANIAFVSALARNRVNRR